MAPDGADAVILRLRRGESPAVQVRLKDRASGRPLDIAQWRLDVVDCAAFMVNDSNRPAPPTEYTPLPAAAFSPPTVARGISRGVFWLRVPADLWGGANPAPDATWKPAVVAQVAWTLPTGERTIMPVAIIVGFGDAP